MKRDVVKKPKTVSLGAVISPSHLKATVKYVEMPSSHYTVSVLRFDPCRPYSLGRLLQRRNDYLWEEELTNTDDRWNLWIDDRQRIAASVEVVLGSLDPPRIIGSRVPESQINAVPAIRGFCIHSSIFLCQEGRDDG